MAYIQPGTQNPTENPNVGIAPTKNFNAMCVSRNGQRETPFVQPNYRPVTVDPAVGVRPMFN